MDPEEGGRVLTRRLSAERGISFVNRAWHEPESLPNEAEIRDPGRWIRRMESGQAA